MHLTKQILWSKNNPLAIYKAGKSQHVLQKRNGIFTSRKDVIYISRLYNTKTILEARKCHCYQYLNYLNLPKTDNSLLNKEEEAWVIWGVKSDSFFDNMKNWRISLDVAEMVTACKEITWRKVTIKYLGLWGEEERETALFSGPFHFITDTREV